MKAKRPKLRIVTSEGKNRPVSVSQLDMLVAELSNALNYVKHLRRVRR